MRSPRPNAGLRSGAKPRPPGAFGGVKDSGYGRESGTEGLQCYTLTKNVSHRMTQRTHEANGPTLARWARSPAQTLFVVFPAASSIETRPR